LGWTSRRAWATGIDRLDVGQPRHLKDVDVIHGAAVIREPEWKEKRIATSSAGLSWKFLADVG